ncbi:transposase [Nitrosomonas eutropha]|uniref:transposase n=1 Tax=Nitrosomonas eutropha TaxID=916 RepID=UPI000942EC1E
MIAIKETRRKYSSEFKQETVALVTQQGYTVSQAAEVVNCLVPRCAGVTYNQLRRDDLWDRYYTEAPARQWRCVERYKIVKRV